MNKRVNVVHVRLDDEEKQVLQRLSAREGKTVSEILRDGLKGASKLIPKTDEPNNSDDAI